MIERYSNEDVKRIWDEENKLKIWFEIEMAAVEAWADAGVVPDGTAKMIREKAQLNVKRIQEIEKITRHDVAAFVQSIEEYVGEEAGKWIHFGMTSSDVLDTALAVQLVQATDILLGNIDELMAAIKRRAYEHQMTPMVGRSHGIHAEPTTVGHVFAVWYDEMRRNKRRLTAARECIAYGKVSGAIGSFSNITPEIEAAVCHKLGLKPALASTQVIQRDRHAELFSAFALIASSIEHFAVQVRHWQRTEVGEAEEKFHQGQKGSSAMPHKRNPVLSENVTGLARYVRAMIIPALENVALWHERDISHSSVERMQCPDATVTLSFALRRMTNIIDNLVFYPNRMLQNLERTGGLPFSQTILLTLIKKGLSRSHAYKKVQSVAMHAFEHNLQFKDEALKADAFLDTLSHEEIENCFDLNNALRHIPVVFARVFEDTSNPLTP